MKKLLPIILLTTALVASYFITHPTTTQAVKAEATPPSLEGVLGIKGNTFTFPSGTEVFDPQWAGETIKLVNCTPDGAENQKVYVAVDSDKIQVFYNSPTPSASHCWQTAEKVDPAIIAKMAQWFDFNARAAGYGILQVP